MTVRNILVPSFWSDVAGIIVAVSATKLGSPSAMALAMTAYSPAARASRMHQNRPFFNRWPRLDTPSSYVTGPPQEPWARSTPSPAPDHVHVVHRTNPVQPCGARSAATQSTADRSRLFFRKTLPLSRNQCVLHFYSKQFLFNPIFIRFSPYSFRK